MSATTGNYQDMNGMKDKFDVALKRIGDEIDKDQAEQNEKNAKPNQRQFSSCQIQFIFQNINRTAFKHKK